MNDAQIKFVREIVRATEEWGKAKKEEGLIPTIDLFVEEMNKYINEHETRL